MRSMTKRGSSSSWRLESCGCSAVRIAAQCFGVEGLEARNVMVQPWEVIMTRSLGMDRSVKALLIKLAK